MDGTQSEATQDVTITVMDKNEPPAAPAAPTVVSGERSYLTDDDESTTSLKVVWHPPDNAGRPDITGYAVAVQEEHRYLLLSTTTPHKYRLSYQYHDAQLLR